MLQQKKKVNYDKINGNNDLGLVPSSEEGKMFGA